MSSAPRWGRLAPGAIAVVGAMWALVAADTPVASVLIFLLTVVWQNLVPGIVVHRLLRGRPATLVEDLAWGFATGLCLMVLVGAGLTALGIARWQAVVPALVVIAAMVSPRGRAALSLTRYDRVISPLAAWTSALAASWAVGQTAWRAWASTALPPGPVDWYADLYWYLGFVGELKRSVPPQVVQVAGEPFYYHWFSTLWMAGISHASGLSPELIVARLWFVPVLWGTVLAMVALGRALSGRAVVGAAASLLLVAGAQLPSSWWFDLPGLDPLVLMSPSHLFGIVVMLALMAPIVDLVRGRSLGLGWVQLAIILATCGGWKSSIVPTMICALLLVVGIQLLARRPLRGAVLASAAMVVGLLCSLPLSSGGSAGASIKLFSTAVASPPWGIRYGAQPPSQFYELVPRQLHTREGLLLLGAILATYAIRVVWLAPGLSVLRRRDPAGWLLMGTGLAGVGATFLVAQDGMSQVYFLRGALPAWALLAVWGLDLTWEGFEARGVSRAVASALLGAGLGTAVVAAAQHVGPAPSRDEVLLSLVRPGVVMVAAMVVAVLALLASRGALRRLVAVAIGFACFTGTVVPAMVAQVRVGASGPALPGAGVLAIVLLCLAGAVVAFAAPRSVPILRAAAVSTAALATAAMTVGTVARLPVWEDAQPSVSANQVTPGQYRAAHWIDGHAGQGDLVATNVHCYRPTKMPSEGAPHKPGCDARGFWVSGFTQRRTLVDGWAYTQEAHAAHGLNNIGSRNQPFHDRQLWQLNQESFSAPQPQDLEQLWDKGVRWLYADTASSPVSPQLSRLADEVYREGTATVYRLRRP